MVQVMIRRGKHALRPFGDVAATDVGYCAWAVRERLEGRRLSRDLKSFATYIQDVHGGVLAVGKHAGRAFGDVAAIDVGYSENFNTRSIYKIEHPGISATRS